MTYLAILVSALAGMVVGAFWYSPIGFGKMWMNLVGLTNKDLKKAKEKGMGKAYGVTFLSLLVMSYVISMFASGVGLVGGLRISFWLWLGFVATVSIGGVLWRDEPCMLYFLNISHWLVVILLMGIINGVWV